MPSRVSYSLAGFIPAASTTSRGASHPCIKQTQFAKQATGLWQAFNNNNAIPDFDPDNMGKPPDAHPKLSEHVSELDILPVWTPDEVNENDESLFLQLAVRKKFIHTLATARMLSGELFSVWGESQALSLLRLVGHDTIVQAYEKGRNEALNDCAVAFTLLEADQLIRANLGNCIEEQPCAVEHYKGLKVIRPQAPEENRSPVIERYNAAGHPELHVYPDHPDYEPHLILDQVASHYQNDALLSICSINELASLTGEKLAQNHLEIYFTLADSPRRDVCRKLAALPEHPYLVISAEKCDRAYEQCCRYFGETFMKQALFGNTHDGLDVERARQNLSLIVPKLNLFLNGEEVGWC